jgi:hypothetical protein
MNSFFAATIAVIALCAATVAAAETCPPLPKAPEIDAMEEVMLPKNPPQVPAPRRHTPMPEAPPEAMHIKLTRAYCRDDCELASSVELRGDAEGVYRGERFYVLVKGEHRFPLAPGTMACLMDAFRAADFWSLAPAYTVDEPALEISTLEVEVAGQHKTVKERVGVRVGAPLALARLELAVEAAGAQSYLVGDANTVPLLQAEHFDFRSRAGAVLLDSAANVSPDAVVLAVLAQGAPANQKVLRNGFSDNSAVATSARRGKLALVRAMVAAGAFKDAPYQMREDALHAAIEDAWPAVVEELINDGADVHARGEEGEEVLNHLGAWSLSARKIEDPTFRADRVTVIKLLLAAGAPIPRTIMLRAETPEEVLLFLATGADIEAMNGRDETPLLATRDEGVAIALLEAGANRNAKDEDGKTIVDKAANRHTRMPRVLAWLRAHPAKAR